MPFHERCDFTDSQPSIGARVEDHDVDRADAHRLGERTPIIEDD
jgi:hypothetical protein